MPARGYRLIIHGEDMRDYRPAFEAAKAFIDSHVADPDILAEMCQTHAKYEEELAKLQPPETKGENAREPQPGDELRKKMQAQLDEEFDWVAAPAHTKPAYLDDMP